MKYSESTIKRLVITFVVILVINTCLSYTIGSRHGFSEAECRYNIQTDTSQIEYGQLYFSGDYPYSYSLYVSEGDTTHHLFDYHHLGGLEVAPR